MQSNLEEHQHHIVYLDTGGLWCLDPILRPKEFHDLNANKVVDTLRWEEYFAHLCDYLIDPNREVRCIIPSAEREGGPLPLLYKSLLKAGVMKKAEVLSIDNLRTPDEELEEQFNEFMRHVRLNPDIMGAWYNLHTHPLISGGWLRGVPEQSDKWKGVSSRIEEFLRKYHTEDLEGIRQQKELEWERKRTALTFSFIQRGYPYHQLAASHQSEYCTHQVRWQVLRDLSATPPDPLIGRVLGGIIVSSLGTRAFKRDAQAIADLIASVREKVTQTPNDWSRVTTENQAYELLRVQLPGLIGDKPSEFTKTAIKGTVAAIFNIVSKSIPNVTILESTAITFVGTVFISTLAENMLFRRRWVNYKEILNLKLTTCAVCGGVIHRTGCLICEERKKAYKNAEKPKQTRKMIPNTA